MFQFNEPYDAANDLPPADKLREFMDDLAMDRV